MEARAEISQLLRATREGDSAARSRLFGLVYGQLQVLARRQLRRRGDASLDTVALINEAYLKLFDRGSPGWIDRGHFFGLAATAMRHLVIDHCRRKVADKRGGAERPATLDEGRAGAGTDLVRLLAVHEALDLLERLDERLARVVELRYFAGLTVEEAAAALAVGAATVKRDWRKARALLYGMLEGERAPAGNGAGPVKG